MRFGLCCAARGHRSPPAAWASAAPDARDGHGCRPSPKGTRYQHITVAGIPVEQVQPLHSETHGTLLYLHGGAYALGSAKGYRGMVAQLGAAAGMTALIPDYSRAPEARYPVALEEMVAVYSRLLDDGLDPKQIVIAPFRRHGA